MSIDNDSTAKKRSVWIGTKKIPNSDYVNGYQNGRNRNAGVTCGVDAGADPGCARRSDYGRKPTALGRRQQYGLVALVQQTKSTIPGTQAFCYTNLSLALRLIFVFTYRSRMSLNHNPVLRLTFPHNLDTLKNHSEQK